MSVFWLLEPEVFQGDEEAVIEVLQALKVKHRIVKFGRSYEEYISDFAADAKVLIHSSFQFAEKVRTSTAWTPGAVCNLETLSCHFYYPKFGSHLLNGDGQKLLFGELNERKEELLKTYGNSVFIRPDNGHKSFAGTVVPADDWDRQIRLLGFYDVEPTEQVIVARPVRIIKEWRGVIVDQKLVCISQYKEDGESVREVGSPAYVWNYVSTLLATIDYKPDPAWTIDIAELEDGTLKVIEVGSFSCAGWYACEPEPLVRAIERLSWA